MAKKGNVNKNAVIVTNHWRKFFYIIPIIFFGLALFIYSIFSSDKITTYAQLAKFTPASCLGGWQNASLVTTSETAGLFDSDYNEENSAVYQDNLSPLYCGDFLGQLPPQTYHTRVTLHFSWYQETINPVILKSDVELEENQAEETKKQEAEEELKKDENNSATEGDDREVIDSKASSTSPRFDFATSSDLLGGGATIEDVNGTSTKEVDLDQGQSDSATSTITEEVEEVGPKAVEESEPSVEESEVTAPDTDVDQDTESPTESEPEADTTTPEEPTASEPVSFWSSWWLKEALANEISVSTSTETEVVSTPEEILSTGGTTTTPEIITPTSTISGTEKIALSTPPAGAQFAIEYTLDGKNWSVLGYVSEVTNDLRFEFPKTALPTLADVKRVQIALIPLLQIDNVPPVYLESLWLEVTYASVGELGVSEVLPYVGEVVPFSDIEIITKSDVASSTLSSTTSMVDDLISAEFTFATTGVNEVEDEGQSEIVEVVPTEDLLATESLIEVTKDVTSDVIVPVIGVEEATNVLMEAVTSGEEASTTEENIAIAEEITTETDEIEVATTSSKLILPIEEIVDVHGIDRSYALLTRVIGTTTRELWLLDFSARTATNLTLGDITIGFYPVAVKDRIIFWYSATYDRIFAYNLRTAGMLHVLNIVGNLPETEAPYHFTFPFTSWEIIAKDQQFVFYSRETGEVFSDENTIGVTEFLEKFKLTERLLPEEVDSIGATGLINYED